jgi:uncharacterized membrane protein
LATTTGDVSLRVAVASQVLAATRRLDSIDLLRGLVMILMALDHTRDFLGDRTISPMDLAHAGAPLFLTRWITNFCAPVFCLLTGAGAYLSRQHRSRGELSWHLLTRGAWLLLLELTYFRCIGMQFNFDYQVTILNVLWMLGWSMIVLSGLVWLPLWGCLALGLVLICGHNLLDALPLGGPAWTVLHRPGPLLVTPHHSVFVAYPLIPWVGVCAAGYGLGAAFAWEPRSRRPFLLAAGLALCLLFVALRWMNLYGEPMHWSRGTSPLLTVLSFLNTSKYPPSLLFLLMTGGPAFLVLWAVDRGTPRWLHPAVTFGRVPLFFYLLHMPLIHILAAIVCAVRYSSIHWVFESPTVAQFPFSAPPGWGLPLLLIYLLWLLVVAAMYPLCRWFAAFKQQHAWHGLSYI